MQFPVVGNVYLKRLRRVELSQRRIRVYFFRFIILQDFSMLAFCISR